VDKNGFAELFESSLAGISRFEPGQAVETSIVSISNDTIFLQLSGKSEGILDRAEMTDKDGNLTVKEGDAVKAYFLRSDNGELRFTTRIAGEAANKGLLENAFRNGIPVEGSVEKEIKGGFEIKIGDSRAFCPFSQMGGKRAEGAESPVGRNLVFKIIEYGENGRKLLVSNRAILEEERQKKLEELKLSLHEGMTVKGKVTSIQSFGAFVDVKGFQALLPVSEMARERVEDIHAVVSEGQEIEASILKIDWKAERMSLSLKALLSDPWQTARDRYQKDSKHKGKVVRVAAFGAFVSLEPGLDGLVHESELRGDGKYGGSRQAQVLKVGDELTVVIKEVDAANRRISLKPASSFEEDATTQAYLKGGDDKGGDTYNPFASLLKKK
jgi:small subunit ribosomal protein S1